jgi:putative two-component system response regulator
MKPERKKIVIVDDSTHNLIACKNILKDTYEVYPVNSADILFQILEHTLPELILMDVEMPVMNGYETARALKNDVRYADIPIIFLTAMDDPQSEMEGLNLGALDYIHKPFFSELLIRRIKTHLSLIDYQKDLREKHDVVNEMLAVKRKEVWNLQNAVLSIVADLVECRDEFTGGHVHRVQKYLAIMIDELNKRNLYNDELSRWDMDFVIASSQLHDVGKVGVSDVILSKPGRLTPEEFEIMKQHVDIGVRAIEHMEQVTTTQHGFFRHAKAFAATHHEKWDGSGYPKGMKGADIPLEGRLMAIVDVYDALVSVRPYKKAIDPAKASDIIKEGRGKHFDPQLVDVFDDLKEMFWAVE